MNELIYLALLWLGWCFLHSFLIHGGAQNAIKKILKTKAIYFRLSYNIFSGIHPLL
jgi:hypothetical protein